MKQHITLNQFQELDMYQRAKLAILLEIADKEDDLNGSWVNLKIVGELVASRCTIGKMIEIIRRYHQMEIYTVDEIWCAQLLDINDCANGQKSCILEISNKELINTLFECVLYVLENMDDN